MLKKVNHSNLMVTDLSPKQGCACKATCYGINPTDTARVKLNNLRKTNVASAVAGKEVAPQ